MKNSVSAFIVWVMILFCGFQAVSQKIEPIPVKDFYKERVIKNLKYLCKESECRDNFVINDRGLYIYPTNSKVDKPEFILYWREMPYFNELLDKKSMEEVVDILKRKGKHYFYGINESHVDPVKYPVSAWEGLRIAIDPGHMAATWEQAMLEKRYVKVEGSLYQQKEDFKFFEANLAYATALHLRKMLEAKGAVVMFTHDYGKSAFNMDYSEWTKTEFKKDIIQGYKNDWYSREKFEYLMSGEAPDFMMFHDVFRNKDFVARADRVNRFKPNLTLVIHYNASENNQRYGDNYLKPVRQNYSMVFIPGSFLGFEVDGEEQLDQRFELLRLLVTYDLEESDVFAKDIIKALNDELKVDALPVDNNFLFANEFSIRSDLSIGVYHRNLYLTRVIRGPIAYAEALYQDNEKEIPMLGKKDLTIDGVVSSSRTKDVAHVYFSAIENWLKYNKEMAKKLDALYEDKYGDEEIFEQDLKEQAETRKDSEN